MEKVLKELLDTESVVLTQIRTTTNYELFGLLKGNREVSESHVKKIRQSLRERQVLEVAIIVVPNPTYGDGRPPFFVVDGQHRLTSIIREKLPLSFVVAESIDYKNSNEVLNIVERLNTASSEWDVTNYMGSKSELGDENYIRYRDIKTQFPFEHEIIFYVIKKLKGSIDHNSFKKGQLDFDLNRYNQVYSIFEWLEKYLPIVEKYGKRYYLKGLLDLYFLKGINLSRLDDVILNKLNTLKENSLIYVSNVYLSLQHLVFDHYNKNLRINKILLSKSDWDGKKYKLGIESSND
jgi:hypothetical protein